MTAVLMLLHLLLIVQVGLGHASKQSKSVQPFWLRGSNVSATMNAASTITNAANFHCDYRGEDPDSGIASPFCECGLALETESWPLMTPSAWVYQADIYEQCAYTVAPACLSCTSMGYYQGHCVSVTDCHTQISLITTSSVATAETQPSGILTSFPFAFSSLPASSGIATVTPITTAPAEISTCNNLSSDPSYSGSTCALQDTYCSLQGSGHALDGLRDVCVLWDKSCCGNSALAPNNYWKDDLDLITSNACFFDSLPDCTMSNPPGRMSAFGAFKNWMRAPQCYASNPLIAGDPNDAMVFQGDEFLNVTCCGDNCQIVADQVDVYYWPDPGADTSCLSIVGDGVSYIADGATKDVAGGLYWGCTVYGTGLGIMGDQSSTVVRTATLSNVAGISYKAYLVNPWDPSQCGNASTTQVPQQNSTILPRDIPAALNPRGHSLIITNSGVNTTVLGTYTFTSPSIYINFQGLHAGDDCGSTSIPSTMVAFSPGELSTITGQIGRLYATPQAFNPKDLPCPPYSVMSQNWYTPLPGVPYRPYFAFPEKLRQISDFKYCNAFYFSVFDPPRTLGPATAMVPDLTTADPMKPSVAAQPSQNAHQPPQATDPAQASATGPAVLAASGDPATVAPGYPRPGVDPKPDQPVPTNRQDSHVLVISSPATETDPTNPNDASAAWMSTLHNFLGPASPVSSRAQPAPHQSVADQPAPTTQHLIGSPIQPSSPIHISVGAVADPARPAFDDPDPQVQVAAPTTIHLGPQPGSGPSTINIGSKVDANQATPGLGAIINGAFGRQASIADAALTFPVATVAGNTLTITDPSAIPIAGTVLTPGGAEVTIYGTPVSLASSGSLVVGSGPPDPSSTILMIAGHTITANPTSFDIAGTPVRAGEPAVSIFGSSISLGPGGDLMIAATTDADVVQPAINTAGDRTLTTNNAGFVIAGSTIAAGSPVITSAGTPISLIPSGILVIGGSTTTLATSGPKSLFTVGCQTFTANPIAFPIAGATLSAGGPAMLLSGTPVSLDPSGDLVIGSITADLAKSIQSSIFDVGGQSFTANPTGFTIARTALSAGGPGITISGTPISLDPSGRLIVGTSTNALEDPDPIPTPSVFTTDGQIFTTENDGRLIIGDATLTNGGPATTVQGILIRISSNVLIIGTNTIPLSSMLPTPSVVTTDGQVFTMEGSGVVVIDGGTLTSGGPEISISGIPMRVDADGFVMGSNTLPLPPVNGSVSTTLNLSISNHSATKSSPNGYAKTTGESKVAAASRGTRALRVVLWAVITEGMMLLI